MTRLAAALAAASALALAAPSAALAQSMQGMPGMKMPMPAKKPAAKKPATRKRIPKNHIPCTKCGRKDLPLHVDYCCPECSKYGNEKPIPEPQAA